MILKMQSSVEKEPSVMGSVREPVSTTLRFAASATVSCRLRELENVIERAITLHRSGRIAPEDLPARVRI